MVTSLLPITKAFCGYLCQLLFLPYIKLGKVSKALTGFCGFKKNLKSRNRPHLDPR